MCKCALVGSVLVAFIGQPPPVNPYSETEVTTQGFPWLQNEYSVYLENLSGGGSNLQCCFPSHDRSIKIREARIHAQDPSHITRWISRVETLVRYERKILRLNKPNFPEKIPLCASGSHQMGAMDRLEAGQLGSSQCIVRIKKSDCLFLWYHQCSIKFGERQ